MNHASQNTRSGDRKTDRDHGSEGSVESVTRKGARCSLVPCLLICSESVDPEPKVVIARGVVSPADGFLILYVCECEKLNYSAALWELGGAVE